MGFKLKTFDPFFNLMIKRLKEEEKINKKSKSYLNLSEFYKHIKKPVKMPLSEGLKAALWGDDYLDLEGIYEATYDAVFHKLERLEKSYNRVARLHNQIDQLGPRQMAVLSQNVERLNNSVAETYVAWTTLVELAGLFDYRLSDHLVDRFKAINNLMANLAVEGEKVLIDLDKADARPNIFEASRDRLHSKVYLAVEKARNEKRNFSIDDLEGVINEDEAQAVASSWSFRYIKSDEDKELEAAEKAKKQRELMVRKYSAASKTWQSKYILLMKDLIGKSPIELSTSYIGASLTTQSNSGLLADNLMKDEKLKPTQDQEAWMLDAIAHKLNTPALISPGGGLSIQSLAFGHAYQMFASDMVSYKAYICSAQNAAVIKTAKAKLALGVKGLIEIDEDGNDVVVDGKKTFCFDENEGSHHLNHDFALSLGLYDESCQLVMQMRTFDSQACDRLDNIGNLYRDKVIKPVMSRQSEMFGLCIKFLKAMYYNSVKKNNVFGKTAQSKLDKTAKFYKNTVVKDDRTSAKNIILKLRKWFGARLVDLEQGKLKGNLLELESIILANCKSDKLIKESVLNKTATDVYNNYSFLFKAVEEVIEAAAAGFTLPEYTRDSMFGFDESEGYVPNRAMFLKGIFVPDYTPNWEFIHGQSFDFDGVAESVDGIKCDLKGFAVDTVTSLLTKQVNLISAKEMRERKFRPVGYILSKDAEECTIGVMKTFNTNSKVRLASQWVETMVPNLSSSESNIKATEKSSKKFLDFWSPRRREQFDEIVKALKKLGNPTSTDWASKPINWDSSSLPNDLYNMLLSIKYRNLRETDFFAKKKEGQLKGNLGGLINLLNKIGFPMESYGIFKARVDSFNKLASEAARGGGIRGRNIVALHSAMVPDYCVVLASWIRKALGFKKNSRPDCVLGRYPVVASTSVSKFTVIWDDDSEFENLFIEAGYKPKGGSIPYMAIVNELGKFLFQMDDDGDTLAIIIALMILGNMSLAEMLDGVDSGDTRAIDKAYNLIESWVAVSCSIPERADVEPVAVELPTIKGGKDKYKVLDSEGNFTKEYLELSGKDSRGAVGLVTDAKSVIIAQSVCGNLMITYNREKGFQLQHSVDAAKKTKLCVPPELLKQDSTWKWTGHFWEIPTETLELLEKWILSYSKITFNLVPSSTPSPVRVYQAVVPVEVREVEKTGLVPTFEKLLEYFEHFKAWLWAPNSLIKELTKLANNNPYDFFEVDGCVVRMLPYFREIDDIHMYHPMQILESMPEGGSWNNYAPYRKPDIAGMFQLKYSEKKDFYYLASMPSKSGFPKYWESTFEGVLEDSVPNTVFKNISRWALEVGLGSKIPQVIKYVNDKKNKTKGKLPPTCELNWSPNVKKSFLRDTTKYIKNEAHAQDWTAKILKTMKADKDALEYDTETLVKVLSYFVSRVRVKLMKEDGTIRDLNMFQKLFAHAVRSLIDEDFAFEDFDTPPKGIKMKEWRTIRHAIIVDVLFYRLSQSKIYSPCSFTSTIDLGEGKDWLEKVKQYATEHLLIGLDDEDVEDEDDSIALTQCPHCIKEIRRQIAAINRNSDEGTHNAKVLREKRDKATLTKTAMESIFMQHKYVADKGFAAIGKFKCVSEDSLLSWVKSYGTEAQKEEYGVQDLSIIQNQINLKFKEIDMCDFNKWLEGYTPCLAKDGSWSLRKTEELLTLEAMEDVEKTKVPLDISQYQLVEILKLLSLFENKEPPFLPASFYDSNPTPPNGGGGGAPSIRNSSSMIEHLEPNEVFVFGSNTEGRHGKGAARFAVQNCGARESEPIGRFGQSYAIVTKDLDQGKRSIALSEIEKQLVDLAKHAENSPREIFLLTPIGCGLAGYTQEEIISIMPALPSNVQLVGGWKATLFNNNNNTTNTINK